ncbi:testis-expressed protein 26 isoform X2 [Sminthopsis crassicaudata]|uniref:testis-expressed protein 26 isoform X2 n=1 Tax=Sminthopsis crassicaudata TaxID=9301 RepID=UPI003D697E2B
MSGPAGDTNWDSYETTMMHEYTPKRGEIPNVVRHSDFKGLGYSYKLNDPILAKTLYTEQFDWKPSSKDDMIRTATSSGSRTNKPHPCKEFMTWKLSQDVTKTVAEDTSPCKELTKVKKAEISPPHQALNTVRSSESSPWRIPATLKEIRKAIADQYTSRFREDYLDNTKLKKPTIQGPLDWKKLIPQRLETEFRRNFQVPLKIPELRDLNVKYGSNATVPIAAACGTVPSILLNHIWNQELSKTQSTYERHYGKESLDLAMLLNSLNENEIKKYLERVPEDGSHRNQLPSHVMLTMSLGR